jgi:SAM-dependent methyltransferase
MIVRLDFGGESHRKHAISIRHRRDDNTDVVAKLGPRLPFKDGAADEVFLDHTLAHIDDFAATMEELWRICKPGTLVHVRLPHASSAWALSRDPRHGRHYTLETFNYFDPRLKGNGACSSKAAFKLEHARLYLTGARGDARGLALARGAFSRIIEGFVNQDRGMQYRWERWFAPLVGGFEELYVVLSAVKQPSFA